MLEATEQTPAVGERESVLPPLTVPAIVALAIVMRTTMAIRTSVIFEDGPHFLDIARSLAAHDWAGALSHPYHPLYSALTALVNIVVDDWETAALTVSVAGGAVAVWASHVFMRDAFGPRPAAFGAFLFAISPYAVRFTSDVESEGVYLAFFVAALGFLWRGLEGGHARLFVGAGASAGLAYLTRPEGIGLVVIGVGLVGLKGLRGVWRVRQVGSACASLAGGALAVASPYLWVLAGRQGGVMLSGKKSVTRILGLSADPTGAEPMDLANLVLAGLVAFLLVGLLVFSVRRLRVFDGALSASGRRALLAAGLFLLVAWQVLWPAGLEEFASVVISTVRPEVALLVALGLFAVPARGTQPRGGFIAAILASYAVVLAGLLLNYGYLSRRHVLPLLPLVLGYAGLGATWLVDRAVLARPRLALSIAPSRLLAGFALGMLAIAAPKALHDHREDVLARRLAAEWLHAHAQRPGSVASTKRRAGYYAGRRWFPLVEEGELRSADSLRREQVRYIVVDDRASDHRDEMLQAAAFDLRERYRIAAGGRSAMVYELGGNAAPETAKIGARPPSDRD